MDDERRRAKQMVKALPFKEKIKHYWSYYKRHVIIFIFSAAIITWGAVQCSTVKEYDLHISVFVTGKYLDENIAELSKYFENYIDEINGNGAKEVFARQMVVDITKDILEPEDNATLSKLGNELSAEEYKIYVFDKPFMEHFENAYNEVIQTVFPMHEIPKMKEIMHIADGEELYFVVLKQYNYNKDDADKVAEYKNVEKVEQHMIELLKESKVNAE